MLYQLSYASVHLPENRLVLGPVSEIRAGTPAPAALAAQKSRLAQRPERGKPAIPPHFALPERKPERRKQARKKNPPRVKRHALPGHHSTVAAWSRMGSRMQSRIRSCARPGFGSLHEFCVTSGAGVGGEKNNSISDGNFIAGFALIRVRTQRTDRRNAAFPKLDGRRRTKEDKFRLRLTGMICRMEYTRKPASSRVFHACRSFLT